MGTKLGLPFLGTSLGLVEVIELKADQQKGLLPTSSMQYSSMVNWNRQPLWSKYGNNTTQDRIATAKHRSLSTLYPNKINRKR